MVLQGCLTKRFRWLSGYQDGEEVGALVEYELESMVDKSIVGVSVDDLERFHVRAWNLARRYCRVDCPKRSLTEVGLSVS